LNSGNLVVGNKSETIPLNNGISCARNFGKLTSQMDLNMI